MTLMNSSDGERIQGLQEPSVNICPDYEMTDGIDAEQIVRSGKMILDPWQFSILSDWMAMDARYNRWVNTTCGLSVPRQNGKTGLVAARSAAGMIMYREEIIYTAHLQKTATETFEELQALFDTPKLKKYVKDVKTALGREQILLKDGGRIKFLARTRNGGRGQHGDLLVFDEAQELDVSQQGSFIPAISASPNPQVIYTGTPPVTFDQGEAFRTLRRNALDGITKKVSWTEFSVAEIGDITDPQRWARVNPALGRRILLSTIQGELEQLPPDVFARERLGWWAPERKQITNLAIPEDLWMSCASDAPKPEGKTAYGVKFSHDGSEVALCGAVIPADGPARVSLIRRELTVQGIQWLADWLNARYKTACAVCIDGKNGTELLIDKIASIWRLKGSIIKPGPKDMVTAADTLIDALKEKSVTWYAKQEQLKQSALTCTQRNISGGIGFGGADSLPIEAASLALWACKTATRDPAKKMRIG